MVELYNPKLMSATTRYPPLSTSIKKRRNKRLINNHSHPSLTMALLRLRAINPNRLCIINLHHKLHRARPRTQRLETREETISERGAGSLETALDDGVVFGEVAEGEGVARLGGDDGGVEGELGVCSDGDGDIGGEGEGEEGEESKGEGGVHDVIVLAWGNNECLC